MTGSELCSQAVGVVVPVKITVWPLPVIALDSAVVVPGGSGVPLKPTVEGDVVNYRWSPAAGLDDPLVAAPIASPAATQAYTLDVMTREGCHAAATVVVEVYYPLRMPGSFTPNGDGKNDVFRVPPAEAVRVRSLVVYNRRGMRVYYTSDAGAGWDGKYNGVAQPSGAYVWVLVFENPVTKREEEQKGTVVLVR
jgi:gliding motility-associated-like protein